MRLLCYLRLFFGNLDKSFSLGNRSSSYAQFIHNCFELCPRQDLHAKTLGFVHPETGQQMDFDSPLPADMAALISKCEDYAHNLAAK